MDGTDENTSGSLVETGLGLFCVQEIIMLTKFTSICRRNADFKTRGESKRGKKKNPHGKRRGNQGGPMGGRGGGAPFSTVQRGAL